MTNGNVVADNGTIWFLEVTMTYAKAPHRQHRQLRQFWIRTSGTRQGHHWGHQVDGAQLQRFVVWPASHIFTYFVDQWPAMESVLFHGVAQCASWLLPWPRTVLLASRLRNVIYVNDWTLLCQLQPSVYHQASLSRNSVTNAQYRSDVVRSTVWR